MFSLPAYAGNKKPYDPSIYITYNGTSWDGTPICSKSIIKKSFKILTCARVINGVRQSYLYFEALYTPELKKSGWINGINITMSIPFRNVLGASFVLSWKNDRVFLKEKEFNLATEEWDTTYFEVAKPIIIQRKKVKKVKKVKGKERKK